MPFSEQKQRIFQSKILGQRIGFPSAILAVSGKFSRDFFCNYRGLRLTTVTTSSDTSWELSSDITKSDFMFPFCFSLGDLLSSKFSSP